MSTKCTIRCGDRWHLYNECFESEVVYLELEDIKLNVNYDNNCCNAILRLDNKLAIEIGLIKESEKAQPIEWENITELFKKDVK